MKNLKVVCTTIISAFAIMVIGSMAVNGINNVHSED